MKPNFDNPQALRLAKELAEATGETVEEAIQLALSERLARIKAAALANSKVAELLAIGRNCSAGLNKNLRSSVDQASQLYDDRGLPK